MSLPPEIIRLLTACLVEDEASGNRTLQLMAFCGVCQRWREYGREVAAKEIAFDGSMDNQSLQKGTVQRFRRAKVEHKRNLFLGASRLFTGASSSRTA